MLKVAPHVGAWIEIVIAPVLSQSVKVAPHVGAWIEISLKSCYGDLIIVAPHVGAWIEIRVPARSPVRVLRRTSRRCVD